MATIKLSNKDAGKPITVITFGNFDLFHRGHVKILERAKALGNKLIVGISTDEMTQKEKNKKCIIPQDHRAEIVASCKYVDEVFFEESLDKKADYIKKFGADILVMGEDWKGKFDSMPCKVVYLPRTEGISTTMLKEELSRIPAKEF
jgi:glycerol-3-phosphate cytidylyltransferase